MKLLKSVLLSGIFCSASFLTFAQGAYVKLGGGYNVGIGSEFGYKRVQTNHFDPNNNIFEYSDKTERVRVNFGKGFTGNAAFGFMFSEQLGAEIEIGYLTGGKNNTSFQRIDKSHPENSYLTSREMRAQMVVFKPSFVVVTRLSENLNLQSRFGIETGKGIVYANDFLSGDNNEMYSEIEFKGGWAFGLQGALGLDYKLNQNFALFSEIRMSNLSYAPDKAQIIKQLQNSQDVLYSSEPHEIPLENSFTNSNENEGNRVDVKQPFNFSTAGLNIGVKYNF